jgi:S-adenosylmethionine hydrolase
MQESAHRARGTLHYTSEDGGSSQPAHAQETGFLGLQVSGPLAGKRISLLSETTARREGVTGTAPSVIGVRGGARLTRPVNLGGTAVRVSRPRPRVSSALFVLFGSIGRCAMDPVVSFMTDFGTSDTSVGQCKGVIASITPKAVVVDISHAVPHFDIETGAWMLESAVRHFPACVHVAVVDPGVGTARRPIAIICGRGDILVGPDNGLLLRAADALGGIAGVVELADPEFRHHPVSTTFHARDIFCPAAAHLAHGVNVHLLGPNIDAGTLVRLPETESRVDGGTIRTTVIGINEFGTVALAATAEMLEQIDAKSRVVATVGNQTFEARIVDTFGESAIGDSIIMINSYGRLSLARNQDNLAGHLGLVRGDRPSVTIRAADTAQTNIGAEVPK